MATTEIESTFSPEFVQELLPSAQRVALLYNVSYLCLANFPKLERMLRERALETQMLFGSSEAMLLKCVLTSGNLVSSLFPMLKIAVEKNKPTLAVRYLGKAKAWINDIIDDVDDLVKKYEKHTTDVATTTSDVIAEKDSTEQKIEKLSKERQAIKDHLEKLKKDLKQAVDELGNIDTKLKAKSNELQQHVQDATREDAGLGIFGAIVPFIGPIVHAIYKTATSPGVVAKTKALENEINQLISEKTALRQKEWQLQNEVINWQMQETKASIELGTIPSPEHLPEVQAHLSKIVQILICLLTFWKKVGTLLDSLEQKTFADEDLVDFLEDTKEEFLKSITAAEMVWKSFGAGCARANVIFAVETKDAYKFLEFSPSSLPKEEWKKAHDAVMEKLKEIEPPVTPTITMETSE
ncbi:hypothetical protein AALO_G00304300 [Alosa alosa]|uniref:Uncharacterized protein n=1 Tax=Alosa alosa TaxID=278164 RepID=A0AAV6FFH8_9TELE|nr:uncharacterized protein si:dkey-7i4.24 [Alosa alosa]KAG5261420.1 hypothetical protein AALO_G00304300 [Alosa alosa]